MAAPFNLKRMIKDEIQLSSEFKSQTTKAIFSIGLFALIYLLILAAGIALTVACIFLGFFIIVNVPRMFTIVLGIGVASLGVFIMAFLVKFLFLSKKTDLSHLHEITARDQPELFDMIREIVDEVGTSFPKRVYVSSEVNAYVFYDSNFWSMFLPIRKNLNVGMGLVNTITKGELKAILAHEFGHFSQKSMKVGSYVYNVNQIIFNMLFDNEGYQRMLHNWASISGIFSFVVMIAAAIANGIQWILRRLYEVVNKSYYALSREMEFHADEIAANVTGFEPLKTSLLRMSIADYSFESAISFYEGKIPENLKTGNIFQAHQFVLTYLAKENKLNLVNNLPEVTVEVLNKFNKSKLVVKDQWASHPSTEERVERLEQTGISENDPSTEPANELFRSVESIQENLTTQMFRNVEYPGEVKFLSLSEFQVEYDKEFKANSFPKFYQGYYDTKNPVKIDFEQAIQQRDLNSKDLFSPQKVDLVHTSISLENDIQLLREIVGKAVQVKTFDYDGKKYKRKEAAKLLILLEKELDEMNEKVKGNDEAIFQFFASLERAKNKTPQLRKLYEDFLAFDKNFEEKSMLFQAINNDLQFVNFDITVEEAQANFAHIKKTEKKIKEAIPELLAQESLKHVITPEIKATLENYISKDWMYFGQQKYVESNLRLLFDSVNYYGFLITKAYFLLKKSILDYQAELLEKSPGPSPSAPQ